MSTDRHTALVVEDEQDLVQLVRVNLELAGFEVKTAHNGAVGLELARSVRPDVILLDVMMPVMDGWQVLRELKEDKDLQDVPVVMLTAMSEERDIIRGHLQGAVRYVTKPFELKTLMSSVEEAVQPVDDEERAARRERVKNLLRRLAELDSGRSESSPVRLSKLESAPPSTTERAPTDSELRRVEALTDKQRYIAEQLAAGRPVRELAQELGVSRSNVYATRKRIARKLSVSPDDVGDEANRLGLEPDGD